MTVGVLHTVLYKCADQENLWQSHILKSNMHIRIIWVSVYPLLPLAVKLLPSKQCNKTSCLHVSPQHCTMMYNCCAVMSPCCTITCKYCIVACACCTTHLTSFPRCAMPVQSDRWPSSTAGQSQLAGGRGQVTMVTTDISRPSFH